MKIAMVVPGGVDASGTDRVIPALLWLVERLAKLHEVHVFAMRQQPAPATWTLLGATVHNIGTEGAHRRRLFRTFGDEHRAAPFDVVHAMFANPWASAIGWRHRVPVVLHLGGGELVAFADIGYGDGCTWRRRASRRMAIAGAARVTVATAYMQELAKDHGIATELVPLGVALDQWPTLAPRNRDPRHPARLLHIGDLRPVKDQRTLLEAAWLLAARGIPFELDVAGVDTMAGVLQSLPAAAMIADRTRWHGFLGRTSLRSLAEQADLLIVTSRHEAGPLAVLEAAVAGVPTVGTAVGHVADWAPDAAFAVPVGDADALARAIELLLRDEPRRIALAETAQRRAICADADATAAAFESIYATLQRPVIRRASVRTEIVT